MDVSVDDEADGTRRDEKNNSIHLVVVPGVAPSGSSEERRERGREGEGERQQQQQQQQLLLLSLSLSRTPSAGPSPSAAFLTSKIAHANFLDRVCNDIRVFLYFLYLTGVHPQTPIHTYIHIHIHRYTHTIRGALVQDLSLYHHPSINFLSFQCSLRKETERVYCCCCTYRSVVGSLDTEEMRR